MEYCFLFLVLLFQYTLKMISYIFHDCAGSLLQCRLFSQLWQAGATLQLCAGFSLWRLLLFRSTVSRARRLQQLQHAGGLNSCSLAPEHRLNRCGAWAYLLCSVWDLPRPGTELVSCIGRRIVYHCSTGEALMIF